jgi:hypothetical protein
MKLKALIFLGLLAAFTAVSCEKHDNDHEADTSKPVVSVTSPLDLAVYSNGDTIRIKGTMEDNEMHEAVVSIMDDTTNAVLFSYAPYVHEKTSITIDTFWKATVSKKTKATLLMQAEDHASNLGSANRKITINP